MKLIRIIKSVRSLLFLNKLRVVLSLTGLAVGITAVIIMVSVGEGARSKMLSQIEAMGSNLITIDAGKVKKVVGRERQTTKVTTLKEKDAEAIFELGQSAGINLVAPTQEQTLLVKYQNGTTRTRIIATSPEYPLIRNFKISSGRFFNSYENKTAKRVAVIGQKTVESLFREANPNGEIIGIDHFVIKINNIPFEVIGVLKPKGVSYDGANEDDLIFIPLKTGMRRVFNVDYIKNIYVHVTEKDKIKIAEEGIRNILRIRHKLNISELEHPPDKIGIGKEDDFTIQNVYTAVKAVSETNESFTMLITGVAALSLLVGGVGILAVMLLSIKERKPEIGLRMAVGAKPNDILFQFLLEAVILSTAGGISGILAGIAGSYLLSTLTGLTTQISFQSILISAVVSISIGILFGAFPAQKACMIEPSKAIKE